mgnify:CR=1 FL=1
MKKKLLQILKYFGLSTAVMLGLVFGISIVVPVEYEEKDTSKNLSTYISSHFTNNSNRRYLRVVKDVKRAEQLWQPMSENPQDEFYCIAPGTAVPMANSENYKTRESILALVNSTADSPYTSCGEAPHVANWERYYSDTYYVCKNEHYTENSSKIGTDGETYENLYDIAFIASFKPDSRNPQETWSGQKQHAIWQSPQLVNQDRYEECKEETTESKKGELLVELADQYQDFYEKIMRVEDNQNSDSYGKNGMKPNLVSSKNNIVLDVDQKEKIAKLGPFKINYVDGYLRSGPAEAASFGGISDMYLIDAAGNKIYLKNIIVNGNLRKIYNTGTERESVTFFSRYDVNINANNENYIDYYAFQKAYPRPNEEFYVEFAFPEKVVGSVKLHVEFSYLKCEMEICAREAGQFYISDYCKGHTNYHTHTYYCGDEDCGGHTYGCDDCRGRRATLAFTHNSQDGISIECGKRSFVKEEYEVTTDFTTTMKIGGFVFEDVQKNGKESLADGRLDKNNDIMLKNIEVSLYEVVADKSGEEKLKLANLATLKQEKLLATENEINEKADYTRRTNPTLTDENGYYEFRGVDPTKKYVVKFTYNGQTYTPTEYLEGASGKTVEQMVKNNQYSSVTTNSIWNSTSKATELTKERDSYDEKFASIGSTPYNYRSSNSLGKLSNKENYNEVFTTYELAGFTLNSDGKYEQNNDQQLIDTYSTLENGKIVDRKQLREGKISQAIRKYIDDNRKYPSMLEIYEKIAGNNEETWKKLQFIEDCKISAYTKNQNADSIKSYDQFPAIECFTTAVSSGNKYPNNSYSYLRGTYETYGTYTSGVTTYKNTSLTKNGVSGDALDPNDSARPIKYWGRWAKSKGKVEYKNIYEGQLFINCGLWKRQLSDVALQKDVYKATIKINGKTETYQYDKRNNQDDYWEIQTRIASYDSYYGGDTYNRALYPSDYNYKVKGIENNKTIKNGLEVYVTYKIAIRNQSQSILTTIDEVVDYYDSTYEYIPKYSWAMYGDINITPTEYYNIVTDQTEVGSGKFRTARSNSSSKYNGDTEYSIEGYKKIYLDGISDYKLGAGETAYLYLTFKVNENANTVELGVKHNIAEINGYTTYYQNGTQLPNGISKNARDVAGIIDNDSKPGNFENSDYSSNSKYEHNFEDDTDHAKGIKVYVNRELIRKVSGVVWEDKREITAENTDAIIADGIRDEKSKELMVPGIKVEMWEVVQNGNTKELKRPADVMENVYMETNDEGSYKFEGFIPGNYIIRFTYGGSDVSATAKGYNGQDYKSTTYQVGIDQNGQTNVGSDVEYKGYTDTANQNSTATYGYDINKADSANKHYSDAKDIWSYREDVNNYSNRSMKYEMANKLNNDKTLPKPNDKLQMIAETGVISVEGEYNRTNSDSDGDINEGERKSKDPESNNRYNNIIYRNGNSENGAYSIQNVDFGLVQRPKAQLELNKQVSNVKIVLANQNVLFDASKSVDNLIWQPKNPYDTNTENKKDNYYKTYGENQNDPTGVYDDLRNTILKNVQKYSKDGNNGLIQPTMDKELTHGATIQITYDITVKNIGEVDYNDKKFYYTGKVNDPTTIVTTSADLLVDYVANNLKYRSEDNKTEWAWKAMSAEELANGRYVNDDVQKELKNYNTIITSSALQNKKLIPLTSSTSGNAYTYAKTQLILTQTITAQNENDDLVYNNIGEIVAITNSVGRRMAFSIQGNQKPSESPQEPDSSMAEPVVILPPFGDTYLYFGLGIAALVSIVGAAIFIKKKVLNK